MYMFQVQDVIMTLAPLYWLTYFRDLLLYFLVTCVCVALIDSRKRFQLGHHCFVKVYLLATALQHKMAPIGTILAICNWHITINNWHYPCKL